MWGKTFRRFKPHHFYILSNTTGLIFVVFMGILYWQAVYLEADTFLSLLVVFFSLLITWGILGAIFTQVFRKEGFLEGYEEGYQKGKKDGSKNLSEKTD